MSTHTPSNQTSLDSSSREYLQDNQQPVPQGEDTPKLEPNKVEPASYDLAQNSQLTSADSAKPNDTWQEQAQSSTAPTQDGLSLNSSASPSSAVSTEGSAVLDTTPAVALESQSSTNTLPQGNVASPYVHFSPLGPCSNPPNFVQPTANVTAQNPALYNPASTTPLGDLPLMVKSADGHIMVQKTHTVSNLQVNANNFAQGMPVGQGVSGMSVAQGVSAGQNFNPTQGPSVSYMPVPPLTQGAPQGTQAPQSQYSAMSPAFTNMQQPPQGAYSNAAAASMPQQGLPLQQGINPQGQIPQGASPATSYQNQGTSPTSEAGVTSGTAGQDSTAYSSDNTVGQGTQETTAQDTQVSGSQEQNIQGISVQGPSAQGTGEQGAQCLSVQSSSGQGTPLQSSSTQGFTSQGVGGANGSGGMWQANPSQSVFRYMPVATSEKWYESLGAHILLVGIITLLLQIPASFFSWVLSDREHNQEYAVSSMTAAWGSEQTLADPEIIIPVMIHSEYEVVGEKSRNVKVTNKERFIRPKQSETQVELVSEKRYKGNYEATLYTLHINQSGYFDLDEGLELLRSDVNISVAAQKNLRIGFNISDNKGIDEIKSIEINGRKYEAVPSDKFSGFEVLVPFEIFSLTSKVNFKVDYYVRGSQKFDFYPLAQVSELKINAQGAIPNFTGSFLPREREVNTKERTFTANYYQNNLSTGQALVSSYLLESNQSHISIELFDDADSYVLIERLTKYVLLFIAMTYVTVLAFEIASKRLVSLVQYVVIGVALLLFYLVLLSFSEHFSFVFSYLLGAITLSLMIALYIKAVFNSKKHAICLFVMLLAMYAVLFAIVHIEAYALLVGTVLLVIMLGIVMYITRHINQKPQANLRQTNTQVQV